MNANFQQPVGKEVNETPLDDFSENHSSIHRNLIKSSVQKDMSENQYNQLIEPFNSTNGGNESLLNLSSNNTKSKDIFDEFTHSNKNFNGPLDCTSSSESMATEKQLYNSNGTIRENSNESNESSYPDTQDFNKKYCGSYNTNYKEVKVESHPKFKHRYDENNSFNDFNPPLILII